jgi:hypothetical protein
MHGDREDDQDGDGHQADAAFVAIGGLPPQASVRDGKCSPAEECDVGDDDRNQEAAREQAVAERAAEPVHHQQHRHDQQENGQCQRGRQHPLAGVRLPQAGKEE